MGAIWMVLTDRKKLAKLMVIQDVSQRELAKAAGWKSHSYLGRLLRGEVNTLDLEPAVRIAMYLQVGTDDLFMSRSSSDSRQNAKRLVAA
ncbi:helix-turn-helix transcriptional regulator [Isoptericola halotolerans]|uniref:helix-turn-helix domain-containing protein n=1 Tax=Isoptericola halotolerans TaxID=300560 RepID=UPI00388EBF2C